MHFYAFDFNDDIFFQVFDLTEEKNKILAEKNHEIEKLMHNSEVLSQEVVNKSQILKEYENEMNELAKNNELLINELEIYKNNAGLQTISESNEDNMVLLESQLENANKRIEDLEKLIVDLEEEKQVFEDGSKNVGLLVTQLENANKHIEDLEKIIDDLESQQNAKTEHEVNDSLSHLSISEEATSDLAQQHHGLLNNYEQLQQETEILKSHMESVKMDLEAYNELRTNFEKFRAEYENMEYQLSEVNVNAESTREENEQLKLKIDTLLEDAKKARTLYEESAKLNEELRTELNIGKLFVDFDSGE